MYATVISGGTTLDGTGAPSCASDVGIEDERIVAVNGKAGPIRRVVDADGHGQDAGAGPPQLVRAGR